MPSLPAGGNAHALFQYLLASSELPEATRRWPAWRQRLVPKIVLELSGRSLGSTLAASGAAAEAADGQGRAETACRAAEGRQQQMGKVRTGVRQTHQPDHRRVVA